MRKILNIYYSSLLVVLFCMVGLIVIMPKALKNEPVPIMENNNILVGKNVFDKRSQVYYKDYISEDGDRMTQVNILSPNGLIVFDVFENNLKDMTLEEYKLSLSLNFVEGQ